MLKKIALFLYLFLPFLFIACSKPAVLIYSSDTPMQVEVRGDSLKILQLTDLHLTSLTGDWDRICHHRGMTIKS